MLGCLAEKEATVPDTYPLTLNALRQACNQSSNRHPVVSYDESTIVRTLDGLKERKLVRFVHPSHGERTTKYRHVLDEALDLEPPELAVITVLLLRGPQTTAELRTRTERHWAIPSLNEVESVLSRVSARDEPLAVELPRQPGQHQARWAHLLAGEPSVPEEGTVEHSGRTDRVAELEDRVADLATRLARLESELGL